MHGIKIDLLIVQLALIVSNSNPALKWIGYAAD